jgi:hypothetical protein
MNNTNSDLRNELDRSEVAEIEDTELEAIAAGLPVSSGVTAGKCITPCI